MDELALGTIGTSQISYPSQVEVRWLEDKPTWDGVEGRIPPRQKKGAISCPRVAPATGARYDPQRKAVVQYLRRIILCVNFLFRC